jgi:hypothetical protein
MFVSACLCRCINMLKHCSLYRNECALSTLRFVRTQALRVPDITQQQKQHNNTSGLSTSLKLSTTPRLEALLIPVATTDTKRASPAKQLLSPIRASNGQKVTPPAVTAAAIAPTHDYGTYCFAVIVISVCMHCSTMRKCNSHSVCKL